ncbi:MAG: hypothetical protein IJI45_18500 [Anaerolineaceae bacterium]|nr:hypothetical protein [Anaerolineaceae bacterium]
MDNEKKNLEQYTDKVPHDAITAIGIENKCYHLFKTMIATARLAGFVIEGTVMLKDRNGKVYDGQKLIEARESTRRST